MKGSPFRAIRRPLLAAALLLAGCEGATDAASAGVGDNGGSGQTGRGSSPGSPQTPGTPAPPPVTNDPDTLDPTVDWQALDIVYSPMYSAYDGVHDFALPAFVMGVATAPEQWQAIPSDAVSFSEWQSDDGSQVGVLIKVEKAVDQVTIAASEGGNGGTAILFITEATPEQWEAGRQRYLTGDTFDLDVVNNDPALLANLPTILSMLEYDDEGFPIFTGTAADLGISSNMRCDTCHSQTAETFQVEHTPTQAARFSDQELATIFTEGKKPEGVGFRALEGTLKNLYGVFHLWNAGEEEVAGLVFYLRSLTPKGQGDLILPDGFVFDIDPSLLPESCDTMGPAYNVAQCFVELPPECNPMLPDFNNKTCETALMMMQ